MFRLLLCFVFFLPSLALAENWPRFRGPNGSGAAADESRPPLEWSESKNLKWKTELPGEGSSSVIVWGDRVYTTLFTNVEGGSADAVERHLVALDRETGEILWDKKVEASSVEDPYDGFLTEHGYASNTPATDGDRIYAFFGKAGVVAFSKSGEELWRADTGTEWSRKRWGSASSVMLAGDLVIVQAGDEARSILAFDKLTGDKAWVAGPYDALEQTYSTPILHKIDEERSDLIVGAVGELWGMNPETGKLRWFAEMGLTGNLSASPFLSSDGVVLQFGGFPRTLGTAIRGGGKGDVTKTNVLWENNDANSYINTPVEHEGYVYWVTDSGIAKCADPNTGELKYEERLSDLGSSGGRGKPFYTAPVIVNGYVLATSRTSGTYIIKAIPDRLEVVRVNKIAGDETRFQGTPAIAGNEIFLRSEEAVYCIGE